MNRSPARLRARGNSRCAVNSGHKKPVFSPTDRQRYGSTMRLLTTQSGLPRLSWGSVIAGVILSLIVYLMFSVLGAAIGMSALSPMSRPNPFQGFGFGSGAYLIVMTVIAVFIGSYFAGRCAPVLGWLHGLLAWAVMILMVIYGATSLVGSAVSAAGSVASSSATVGARQIHRNPLARWRDH